MDFRSAYTPSEPIHPETGGPSLTKQSMSAECDINTIMKRYEKTGIVNHVSIYKGDYGDFISEGDYHSHLNLVIAADAAFQTLPAKIRRQFDNDPSKFLEFVDDDSNTDQMIEMGLVKPQASPEHSSPDSKTSKKSAKTADKTPSDADISGDG